MSCALKYTTADVAAYILQLSQRIPAGDRVECIAYAVQRKFPGLDDDQLREAQEIAAARLKRWRR